MSRTFRNLRRRDVASPPPTLRVRRLGAPALVLALALAGCKGDAPPSEATSAAASGAAGSEAVAQQDPKAWVRDHIEKENGGDLGVIHVNTAKVDLDGDGTDEILAYASGSMMCGTGGCNLLVLKSEAQGFKVVGDLSVVQLPVGVLDSSSNGWRDLAVSVSGGGIASSIRRVAFEDGHYASNPTSPDTEEADSLGKVLLTPDMLSNGG